MVKDSIFKAEDKGQTTMNAKNIGTLYIVSTPIGNLQDISFRAIETLKSVDLIAAEDTRHSKHLLMHYGITTSLISLHEHNETQRIKKILALLKENKNIALISDAGTPLISDPGFILVKEAQAFGAKIIPIPGACAAITALSASGLPTDKFLFEGFLPLKNKLKQQRLMKLTKVDCTIIFYEAPHRIKDFFNELMKFFPLDRKVVIARELSKKFETIQQMNLSEVLEWFSQDDNRNRGEFVILVEGTREKISQNDDYSEKHILEILLKELPLKQAVSLATQLTGKRKNEIYELALILNNEKKNK